MNMKVTAKSDTIYVEGTALALPPALFLHKPSSAFEVPQGPLYRGVGEAQVPSYCPHVGPVGRLEIGPLLHGVLRFLFVGVGHGPSSLLREDARRSEGNSPFQEQPQAGLHRMGVCSSSPQSGPWGWISASPASSTANHLEGD